MEVRMVNPKKPSTKSGKKKSSGGRKMAKLTKAQRSAAAKKGWRKRQKGKGKKKTSKKRKKGKMTKAQRSAAAKKGWRKRQKGKGKKKTSKKKRKTSKKRRNNPKRKKGKMTKAQRSAAAKKGWRKRRKGGYAVTKKSSKKRRKRSKSKRRSNPKRTKASRSRAAKKGWRKRKKGGRRRRRNPSYSKNIKGYLKRAVDVKGWMQQKGHMLENGAGSVMGVLGTASVMYVVDEYTEEMWWAVPAGFCSTVLISEVVLKDWLKMKHLALGYKVGGFITVSVRLVANIISWASGSESQAAMTGVLDYSIDDILSDIKSGKILDAIKIPTMKGLGLDRAEAGLKALGIKKSDRSWINDPTLMGRKPRGDLFYENAPEPVHPGSMERLSGADQAKYMELKRLQALEREMDAVINQYGDQGGYSGYVNKIIKEVDSSLM